MLAVLFVIGYIVPEWSVYIYDIKSFITMRLTQIKLSGFKSFLEPTTLVLNTRLTGIVGPNGCGKSNIVDAIRWVVGESSAKQLRGENLADVIFGGSSSRKPVGKAQVELIFDNSDAWLGGRFSEYHQISIKREMTRDSGSNYFLNQTPCRRRDIMDILLGTGLGPRSYAVIEQGMISHLVSATPEELRAYLEEAAMISKYKERRKEAEHRIAQTRENIVRIQDLVTEISEQIKKVKSQAVVAQTYKEWKKALQLISAQLEVLEINSLQKKLQQTESSIQTKESYLSQSLQEELQISEKQEQLSAQHAQEISSIAREQDEYYRFSVEISRLEQSLKDAIHQKNKLNENLKQLEQNQAHLNRQLEQDQLQRTTLQEQENQNESLLASSVTELTAAQAELSETQGLWRAWQQQCDQFNKTMLKTQQAIEIKENQRLQLQRLLDSLKQRYERLKEDAQELAADKKTDEIVQWESELALFETQIETIQLKIQMQENLILNKNKELKLIDLEINENSRRLQQLEAERDSLKSLQSLTLEDEGEKKMTVVKEVKQQGLNSIYFLETIKSDDHQNALESILKDLLNTFCINDLKESLSFIPLGKETYVVNMQSDEKLAMLARQQKIDMLSPEIAQQQLKLASKNHQKTSVMDSLTQLKAELEALQLEKNHCADQKTRLHAHLCAKKNYFEQIQNREKKVQEETLLLEQQLVQYQAEYVEIQKSLENLRSENEKNQEEDQRLQVQQRELTHGFELARTTAKNKEQKVQQLHSLIEISRKQIHYLDQQNLRAQEQIQSIEQQFGWLNTQLNEINTALPNYEASLAMYEEKRCASDLRLKALKMEHQATEHALMQLKNLTQEKKSSIEQVRTGLERLRIEHESMNIQCIHHKEQVSHLGFEWDELLKGLPKEINKSQWKAQQSQLNKNIQNLGEVNLAASQEYEILLQRKEHLDEQSQDLIEALKTLEEAIGKIDQETCVQLKNTFDQVNQNFMNLFSKIFEGGHAALELTANNWLSAGVIVKAQPKGKRNATIHLLSGGEKALTAIALVFAFFQLNPAPFCILDEVDAPLDDHNIERFCKLVEEMSTTLQFVFISHSKVTLTMAKQLVGVTMKEPGVSRIVSVDMEEAVRVAAQ